MKELDEWVDGFLFVGNRLALDFLNTRLVDREEDVEKLADWAAFSRWCAVAGLPTSGDEAARYEAPGFAGEGRVEEVRGFRERLREAVSRLERGEAVGAEFVAEINSLLSRYPARVVLDAGVDGVAKRTSYDGFWGAMAAAVVELLTETDQHRVRKCEHCIVHFYDVSKKGSRRWCSMGMCGNRVKVAVYQRRRRGDASVADAHSSR